VHGGGYTVGDKAQSMRDKVRLFNERGWILVSVNYRLSRPGDATPVRYPDHYADVANAVSWILGHIAEYGGDPQRVALLGHSAGADIVSNVLLNPVYLANSGMKPSDLACAGPLDSEGFDKVAAGKADIRGLQQEWAAALGNAPDYLRTTSANWLIAPGLELPPIVGVIRGSSRRHLIETAFLAKLRAVGVPTTAIDASLLTHHEVNSRIGAHGDTVMTPPLMRFLEECLGAGSSSGRSVAPQGDRTSARTSADS
jgi:acetyl esterase/lipase